MRSRKDVVVVGILLGALLVASGCARAKVPKTEPLAAPEPEKASASLPELATEPPLPGPAFSGELREKARAEEAATPGAEKPDSPAKEARPPEPPGEEMARLLAERIAKNGREKGAALPPPHDPNATNNYFSLVRSADDLSGELPTFALADDGKKLAFVREEDVSLWFAAADGSGARKVFTANKDLHLDWEGKEEVLHTSGLFDLKFAPNGKLLYFQTDFAATSLGLAFYDERTGRVHFATSANGYDVIRKCAKAPNLVGSLIAYRHDYSILPMQAADLYFLLDSRGENKGPIGAEEENVARFLYRKCGEGTPVPAPQYEKVPPAMRRTNVCGDVAFRYLPLEFLDGSVAPIFYAVRKAKANVPRKALASEDYESTALGVEEATELLERCRAGE